MAFSLYRRPALERRSIMLSSSLGKPVLPPARCTQSSPRQRPGFRPRDGSDREIAASCRRPSCKRTSCPTTLNSAGGDPGSETGQPLRGWRRQCRSEWVGGQRGHGHQHALQHLDFAAHAPFAGCQHSSQLCSLCARCSDRYRLQHEWQGVRRLPENGKTGSSVFQFDTADGTISGWSPSVDSTNAIVAVTNPGAS